MSLDSDSAAKVELLKHVPLFEGCSDAELSDIADVAAPHSFPAGKELIAEGDHEHREFFVIVKGNVDIIRGGQKVNELSDGDFFGEIQLLADTPRLASVVTTSDVTALVVTEDSFRHVITTVPTIAVKMVYPLAEMVAYYARQA